MAHNSESLYILITLSILHNWTTKKTNRVIYTNYRHFIHSLRYICISEWGRWCSFSSTTSFCCSFINLSTHQGAKFVSTRHMSTNRTALIFLAETRNPIFHIVKQRFSGSAASHTSHPPSLRYNNQFPFHCSFLTAIHYIFLSNTTSSATNFRAFSLPLCPASSV